MTTSSEQIQKSYISDLTNNLPRLEKKASDAINSFADLVAELKKVSDLSAGTPVKDQIKDLTANMNNTQVFFTKMLTEQLGVMHNIVNGDEPDNEPKQEVV